MNETSENHGRPGSLQVAAASQHQAANGDGLANIRQEQARKECGRNYVTDLSSGQADTVQSLQQSKNGVAEEPEAEARTLLPNPHILTRHD